MFNNYFFPKMKYAKNEVSFMYLFFDNGDYLEIKGSEIVNLSLNVYDKLIRSYDGYNPVAKSGYFKLKICNKHRFIYSSHFLYNEGDFKKNRKAYIENRCINEGGITEIWLFNKYNWHKVLHCRAQAKMDSEFLLLEIISQPLMGSYQSENHYVNIRNIKKDDICNIDLDFENCESFVVYNDEIEEVNINFDNQLEWGTGDLNRKAIGGYIRIKLNRDFTPRQNNLWDNHKKLKIVDFERRLCGENGEDAHDICHLYINYNHAGYGTESKECIEIEDVAEHCESYNDLDDFDNEDDDCLSDDYWDDEDDVVESLCNHEEDDDEDDDYWGDDDDCDDYPNFEGGYCKKYKDGSIIITFGKNAKDTINKLCNND